MKENAHSGPVNSLVSLHSDDDNLVASGGQDGTIKIWSSSFELLSSTTIDTSLSILPPQISSLDFLRVEGGWKLAAGCVNGDIFEFSSFSNGTRIEVPELVSAEVTRVLSSHSKGELWGLAPHPLDPDIVATAGDDGNHNFFINIYV